MTQQPDSARADDRLPPRGTDDATVEAVGKLTEAWEWIVRARGSLYQFHQEIGRADQLFSEGVDALRDAGHPELADELTRNLVGRNVLPGMWTFQVVEAFDDTYFGVAAASERRVRTELMGGQRHVKEAEMKQESRTDGPTDDQAWPA